MTYRARWCGASLAACAVVAVTGFSAQACAAQVNVTCKNTTADAAKLNGAIGDSHAGDAILIHGTCLVEATIVLLGDRSYLGDARTGTIIRQAAGSNLPAMLASDSWANNTTYTGEPVTVAHLTLDGNGSANIGTSAPMTRSWQTVLEDLQIENAPQDGILVTGVSQNGTALTGTQVNGRISDVVVTHSGANGIHVTDTTNAVTDWSLLDSWIADSGQSGITMDNAAGWTVRGNHIYGVKQNALLAKACFATTIDGNYIEDFGDQGGKATWYGIACTVQGGASSAIIGNKVFMFAKEKSGSSYAFISAPVVNYGIGELEVTGNTIRGAGGASDIGLSFALNGGAGLYLLTTGNSVEDVATARVIGKGVTLAKSY